MWIVFDPGDLRNAEVNSLFSRYFVCIMDLYMRMHIWNLRYEPSTVPVAHHTAASEGSALHPSVLMPHPATEQKTSGQLWSPPTISVPGARPARVPRSIPPSRTSPCLASSNSQQPSYCHASTCRATLWTIYCRFRTFYKGPCKLHA